ncbi:hypothetical protein [Paenibacillus campi]|uniref:hypothetical protein n=2 Tax=Paenibacillus campi TaxID=3106031 RepID=UPI002AFFAAB9|nr:hypothetical protein [Paenibacillus sp. SGZ-1009]
MFHNYLGKLIYELDRENNVLVWRVTDQLDYMECKKICDLIKSLVLSMPHMKAKIIADKRYSYDKYGHALIFSRSVSDEWMRLQEWLISHSPAVAVLCGTLAMKAQTNRLSKQSGSYKILRSFYDKDQDKLLRKAYAFLEIQSNTLAEMPDTVWRDVP